MNIPEGFWGFMREAKIELLDVIHVHEDKLRVVAKIRRGKSKPSLIKWNASDNPHCLKLQKEAELYQKLNGRRYMASLISYGPNHLEISFVEGRTLREFLLSYVNDRDSRNTEQSFDNLKAALKQYYAVVYDMRTLPIEKRAKKKSDSVRSLASVASRLNSSGPAGTGDLGWNKAIRYAYKARYQSSVKKKIARALSNYSGQAMSLAHADFHLNNMMVTPDLNLVVIDWENAKTDFTMSDEIYSGVMIKELLRGQDRELALFDQLRDENYPGSPSDADARDRLVALCSQAVAVNPRFHRNVEKLRLIKGHALLGRTSFLPDRG